MNKSFFLVLIHLLIIYRYIGKCHTIDFDFFYFSLQWPGSRCNTEEDCCYPTTGKPNVDFIITGLQPIKVMSRKNPTFCDPTTPVNLNEIFDLVKDIQEHWPSLDCPSNQGVNNRWQNWAKFGTCSNFNQYRYFQTPLHFKTKVKLLQVLENKGIRPNGKYSLDNIRRVIHNRVGFVPVIYCNKDKDGNHQLYEIHFCINKSGEDLTPCPDFKTRFSSSCKQIIKFPSF